ncbi:MAG: aldehyde ferredoxin oxidoreductase C-terminal domain-containing protein [Pirellulaceae bacterium]
MDSLILCKFVRGVFQSFYNECAQMVQATTGWSIGSIELQELACHIVDMKKQFNVRAGWTPAEDWLPQRFFSESLDDREGTKILGSRLQILIEEYNRYRGWNIMGFPQNMENGK